jgi:acyl carrier protein
MSLLLESTMILLKKNQPKHVESPLFPASPYRDRTTGLLDEAVIREWLITKLSQVVGIPITDVDPTSSFAEYGLDSMQAVRLSGDLERWMGFELPPILLYDYPTIDALARCLVANPPVPAPHH